MKKVSISKTCVNRPTLKYLLSLVSDPKIYCTDTDPHIDCIQLGPA